MTPALFASPVAFSAAFSNGLRTLLTGHGPGAFILALANASNDPQLWRDLAEPLRRQFDHLARAHTQGELAASVDDMAVFEALSAVGFGRLQCATYRTAGPWRLQFNQMRSFRPPRMSNARVSDLQQPFDPAGFHFNKPFLASEILWQGELLGNPCRWLYNKFPFAPLHTLLVLDPDAQRPQWLRERDHRQVWQLTEQLGEGLPGLGFGYNAYGAYSSVNHQHFQGFVDTAERYPVEADRWQHNGGEDPYPVACRRHQDATEAWADIDALHRASVPYNLLYRPGCCYVLPRAFQGSYEHAPWTAGFAWSEMAGAITLFDADDMAALDRAAIETEFAKLRR